VRSGGAERGDALGEPRRRKDRRERSDRGPQRAAGAERVGAFEVLLTLFPTEPTTYQATLDGT